MPTTWSDKRCAWLALHLISGLGNVALKNLLRTFGNPEAVLQADLGDLLQVEGIRREIALKIFNKSWDGEPAHLLRRIDIAGIRILTYLDPDYPAILKQIHDPPMILYLKGREIPHKTTFVALVGSRHPSPYGLKAAEKIAKGIAARGVGIVSGMARGIDSAAHRGCLGGYGFTIAVLGTGIDIVYPTSNKDLYDQIAKKGTVISEFPPGTPPEPKNFPIRNRIISGLSRGIVVVEATKNSGSLITASLALEQGREVFAVPGSINSFKSSGCHFLIKQGAALVENSDDVLEGLGLNYNKSLKIDVTKEPTLPLMDDSEKAVFGTLGDYPVHIDQIAREAKLEHALVSGVLVRMELKGLVKQLPGKMFVR